MKRITCFVSLFLAISFVHAQDVQVNVNVAEDRSPISPYIYGANVPTDHASAMRWGGNRTTTYNWENNYSNAGEDYHHISDGYFINSSGNTETVPAEPVIENVQDAHARNQYSLITLQAAGFVAADGNGSVSEEEAAPSSRWDSIVFRKNAEFSLEPDKTDGVVYIDEYVHYLTEVLGEVGEGGIDGFGIDNEPALWRSTHPRIRPDRLTIDELFGK
ncbi:MAG: glycoside hydrolase family 44 protein, partial [Bacteroidales bacterium]